MVVSGEEAGTYASSRKHTHIKLTEHAEVKKALGNTLSGIALASLPFAVITYSAEVRLPFIQSRIPA